MPTQGLSKVLAARLAQTGSSENVRAYSATTKRMEPIRLLKAIFTWEMTTPTSSSIFGGWGTEDRGRALFGRGGASGVCARPASMNPSNFIFD